MQMCTFEDSRESGFHLLTDAIHRYASREVMAQATFEREEELEGQR